MKSRLQSSRESTSLPRLAAEVIREEGVGGLWRGFPLPLITISIVRTISFTIYTSTKRILNTDPSSIASASASGTDAGIDLRKNDYGRTNPSEGGSGDWVNVGLGLFGQDKARDVAITSLLAGGASGAVVCVGSAPFELVKVSWHCLSVLAAESTNANRFDDNWNTKSLETLTLNRLLLTHQTPPSHHHPTHLYLNIQRGLPHPFTTRTLIILTHPHLSLIPP